jgi:hypothetical protein
MRFRHGEARYRIKVGFHQEGVSGIRKGYATLTKTNFLAAGGNRAVLGEANPVRSLIVRYSVDASTSAVESRSGHSHPFG